MRKTLIKNSLELATSHNGRKDVHEEAAVVPFKYLVDNTRHEFAGAVKTLARNVSNADVINLDISPKLDND